MSKDKIPQSDIQEEVDLGQLFNAVGRLFERIYKFFAAIVKFIFTLFVYASKAIVENLKLISVVIVVAAILGYIYEMTSTKRYESTMLVRTYFDAKYQLATNLNYYNSLIKEENYQVLSNIFNIDNETIKNVVEFELNTGPETENVKIVQYDNFLKSLDSIRAQEISYEEFVDNRDLFSGDLFEIRVESTQINIFKELEFGVNNSFENLYSLREKQKRDSMLVIRRQTILSSISQIDSLKKVYIGVLEEESKATKANINLGEGFPLQQEKTNTREFELLTKEIELRNDLRRLDEEKIIENDFFDVISSFQEVGNEVNGLTRKYSILFPAIAFVILCLIYLTKKYIRFIKKYEA